MAIMRRDVRFYPDETATHGVFLYKQLLDCEARWQSLSAAGLKDERRAQWSARKSLEDDLHAAGFDTESYRLGSRIGIAIARRREERDARRRDPWGTYTNAAPTGRLRRLPAPPMSEEQKRERQLAALAQEQERRQKAIAALAPHQIAALRAVVTSNGLDEFDAFTFDVLGRMGLLMRPKGTKTKTAWQLTDEGVGPAWPKKKGTGTMAGPPNRTSLW
jgi:hypothetical protein